MKPLYAIRLSKAGYEVYRISDNTVVGTYNFKSETQRSIAAGKASCHRNDLNREMEKRA